MARTVRIHLGAHKTATTYLQSLLELNRGRLVSSGTVFWPLESVRPIFNQIYEHRQAGSASRLTRMRPGYRKRERVLQQRLSNLFQFSSRIVLSEENLLGDCGNFFSGEFYPNAEGKLAALTGALPDRPLEFWLCLRSYPEFLSSIYGEALRHGDFLPMEEFEEMHADPEGNWPRLVELIRDLFPGAMLKLWRYEDFRKAEPQIVGELTGVEYWELDHLTDHVVRPSASAAAILAFNEVAADIEPARRVQKILALEHELPLESKKDRLALWREQQAERMAAAYHRDIARLVDRSRSDGNIRFVGQPG